MLGPGILARTLTATRRKDKQGKEWQYLSRSDHHSKVACWGVVFDLLSNSSLFRQHVASGLVHFGINHEMKDFVQDQKKNLDLVICTPASCAPSSNQTFASLAEANDIVLDPSERAALSRLPELRLSPVGGVLIALEAKACMTAHQRALPRLYSELNSSHLTVHGSSDQAIAAGFTMVNMAPSYLSPDLNKTGVVGTPRWSKHNQPRDAQLTVDKLRQLPRRSRTGDRGYDALAIVVIDCANDGSDVRLVEGPPAPQPGDIYHYASMIDRLAHIYATRFKEL